LQVKIQAFWNGLFIAGSFVKETGNKSFIDPRVQPLRNVGLLMHFLKNFVIAILNF
jgi:hypothetical protein